MNRISVWLRATTVTACLAMACGGGTAGGPGPETGGGTSSGGSSGARGSAPDFALDDIDGDEFRLADHIGESVMLLNFWATWCEPCRVEMPHLDRVQQTYRDQGLRVICISMDGPETVARVRPHMGRYNFDVTVLLDEESEVTQLYNPRRAAPFNALIDREGNIVWSHEGYAPGDEQELEAQIRAALGLAEGAE
jgi:peroxiredoxin